MGSQNSNSRQPITPSRAAEGSAPRATTAGTQALVASYGWSFLLGQSLMPVVTRCCPREG